MQEAMESIVLLLSPIVPHICHALWRELRPGTELLDQPWPQADNAALVQDEIELIVQVNGKLRGKIRVARDTRPAVIERLALKSDQVRKFVAESEGKKGRGRAGQIGQYRCLKVCNLLMQDFLDEKNSYRSACILFLSCCLWFSVAWYRPSLPFETLYISFPAGNPIGTDLRRLIKAGTKTRIVDKPKDAQATLESH